MSKFFEKIKKIKNIEIYLAVAVVVIIIAIYFSTLTPKKEEQSQTQTESGTIGESYADMIESKLESVIKSIKGVGTVAIMVMTDGEGTSELAYDIEEKTVEQVGANGQKVINTVINKKTLLGTGGKPIILWTIPPKILGVVVVATGAGDVTVRLCILNAVQTVITDIGVKIQILTGN
jgi:stage III sporulation protein AG